MSLRDEVWNESIRWLVKYGEFSIEDLPFHASQRHTVKRTLSGMEELAWLRRDPGAARTWQPGVLALQHFDVPQDVDDRSSP